MEQLIGGRGSGRGTIRGGVIEQHLGGRGIGRGMIRGGGRTGQVGTRRRFWSREEEELLISIVKRLINEGWKSGNGWRGGFFRQVELYMKEKLPHSDIRGEPHVNSKLTVWKREYVLLFEFMKLSGVAIEPSSHMIVVDQPDIWDNYVKIVPDIKNFYGKPFPYYEHWCEIFGKDRATGEHATDYASIAHHRATADHHHLDVNKNGTQDGSGLSKSDKGKGIAVDENLQFPEVEMVPDVDEAVDASPGGSSSGSRKRKLDAAMMQPIVNLMSSYMNESQKSMDALTKAIEATKDANHDTVAVFDALGKLPSLPIDNHILAAQKLVNNPQELALFFSMPDEAKFRFVTLLLKDVV